MNLLNTKYLIGLMLTLSIVFIITSNFEICTFGGSITYDSAKLNDLCGVSSHNELLEQTRYNPSFCPEREEARIQNSSCGSSFSLITLSLLISLIIYTLIYRKFA